METPGDPQDAGSNPAVPIMQPGQTGIFHTKGGAMALVYFLLFMTIFLFGLICLLAVLGSDGYYDREDDEEQEQFLMSWKRDHDKKDK